VNPPASGIVADLARLRFPARSGRYLKLASTLLFKKHGLIAKSRAVTARRLAEFFQSVEAEERLRKLRLKDKAQRRVLKGNESEIPERIVFEI
jgi:hypothetical protein